MQPLIRNLWQSFYKINLMQFNEGATFIGFENFRFVLTNKNTMSALAHSGFLTVMATGLNLVIAFGLALLLDRPFVGRNLVRSLLILPWAVPSIVVAFIWQFLSDINYGMFNHWLLSLGLVDKPVAWLIQPISTWFIVIAAHVWKGLPVMLLILMAGLKQIPNELYDAAKVDGASALGTLRWIIIPNMLDVIAISVVLRTIWYFNWYDLVALLTGGGPARYTETMPLIAYRTAFTEFRLGRASAISAIMFMILLVLVFFFFEFRRRRELEAAT